MMLLTRHGRSMATEPMDIDEAPAEITLPTSSGRMMPPPAFIGFFKPQVRASFIQSQTMGSRGLPERPPFVSGPKDFVSGEILLPYLFYQWICSGSSPQGYGIRHADGITGAMPAYVGRRSGRGQGVDFDRNRDF